MSDDVTAALEACRRAEKEQALFYRALGAEAERHGDAELAQRFHDLHADEQHHLSRLTARLIELGCAPADLADVRPPAVALADCERAARERERGEVARYEALLGSQLDGATRALAEQIVGVERTHAEELGGKWTMA